MSFLSDRSGEKYIFFFFVQVAVYNILDDACILAAEVSPRSL